MSQQKFVDREEEMKFLEEQYARPGSSFVVVYGRRRVGKTSLILRFLDGKGIYFLATNEGDKENIRSFQQIASSFLRDPSITAASYPDWISMFTSLVGMESFQTLAHKSKLIIAIDEFPFLIEGNRSISSVFQKIFDTILRDELLIGECKWTNKPVTPQVIEDLISKSSPLVDTYPNSRITYAVFSRRGFTDRARSLEKDNLILMDLENIRNSLK